MINGSTAAKLGAGMFMLALLAVSCKPDEQFPDEPVIEFKSFEQFGDSASLVINFTDGDGDIGLAQGDTLDPYDEPPYDHNLFLEYFERREGEWFQVTFPLPLYYRIPVISPTGQNPTLEGEIAVALAPFPTNPGSGYDTIKYSVQLYDRALNISNVVETGTIVIE